MRILQEISGRPGFYSISLPSTSLGDKSRLCHPMLLHSPLVSPYGYSYRSVEHQGAFFQSDSMLRKAIIFFPGNMPPSDQLALINYVGSIITHQYENIFDALLY